MPPPQKIIRTGKVPRERQNPYEQLEQPPIYGVVLLTMFLKQKGSFST
jgi:hypothetical protein